MTVASTYEKYLEGKTVALVCGGQEDDEFIRDCDVFVSISMKALTYDVVDIAYLTGGVVAENFVIAKNDNFDWVWHFLGYPNAYTLEMIRQLDEFYEARGIPCAPYIEGWRNHLYTCPWAEELFQEIKTQPLSGLLVLTHLLQFPLKQLRVTGMTFFAKDGLVPFARDVHRLGPQREYVKRIRREDSRVFLDDACCEALRLPIEDLDWKREDGQMNVQVIDPRDKSDGEHV